MSCCVMLFQLASLGAQHASDGLCFHGKLYWGFSFSSRWTFWSFPELNSYKQCCWEHYGVLHHVQEFEDPWGKGLALWTSWTYSFLVGDCPGHCSIFYFCPLDVNMGQIMGQLDGTTRNVSRDWDMSFGLGRVILVQNVSPRVQQCKLLISCKQNVFIG